MTLEESLGKADSAVGRRDSIICAGCLGRVKWLMEAGTGQLLLWLYNFMTLRPTANSREESHAFAENKLYWDPGAALIVFPSHCRKGTDRSRQASNASFNTSHQADAEMGWELRKVTLTEMLLTFPFLPRYTAIHTCTTGLVLLSGTITFRFSRTSLKKGKSRLVLFSQTINEGLKQSIQIEFRLH